MHSQGEVDAEEAQRHSIAFTASGSEYFRIWIVNLLLTVVTLGIYLPWAKVRKLKYFYSNTWIDGDALDFHGEPRKMLRGTLIAAGFLIVYSIGVNVSGWAALVATLAFVALWPALFRASMRFRLANTSWRGLRLRFTGDMGGAYASILPPLAVALLPFALAGTMAAASDGGKPPQLPPAVAMVLGLAMMVAMAGLPYFLWRVKRYQHGNYAIGQIRTHSTADAGIVYGIFIKLIGITMLAVALLVSLALLAAFMRRLGVPVVPFVVVGVVGIAAFNVLPKAYLQVRLQNHVWSTTGSELVRFESRLGLGSFFRLQLKNFVLIPLTLGLYWPFALVNTRRAQVEVIALRTHFPLDRITQAAGREDPGATGDMAADLFGLDIGM